MTQKALDRAENILDKDPDTADDERFGPIIRAQTSVITSVLNTQAKVDENRLRRQTADRLPALLALVNKTAKRLPQVIEHEPR